MGRLLLVALVACAPAATLHAEAAPAPVESKLVEAYAASEASAVRARVVCALRDVTPTRWSDVEIRGDVKTAACEIVLRSECGGRGDVVRGCSSDPLPGPLVPRGVVVLRQELPESIRYETFATEQECADALRDKGPPNESAAWLDAQIAVETRDLDASKAALKKAERKLADARSVQAADIALLQLDVERLRRERDLAEKLLGALREQRSKEGATIACVRAGGS